VKTSLNLSTRQSLALTPQLRLAIRILRHSALELEAELAQSVEANPLLELDDPDAGDQNTAEEGAENINEDLDENAKDQRDAIDSATDLAEDTADAAPDLHEFEDFSDPDWAEFPAGNSGASGDSFAEVASDPDLKSHLAAQVDCLRLNPLERLIAAVLIDGLSDDGRLLIDDQAVIEALALCGVTVACPEIEVVRLHLLRLDPAGCGARSAPECLAAQLHDAAADNSERELALRIVTEHLQQLATAPEQLRRQLDVADALFNRACSLIRSLDPYPGRRFGASTAAIVRPDLEVYRERERWQVRLLTSMRQRLRLSHHYANLAQQRGADPWIKGRFQEAQWLLRAVDQRESTLLAVGRVIVTHQNAFFDFGAQAMRPLSMREVADQVGMHESTISRAVAGKYLATPRGVLELRQFFPVGLATSTGGQASSTAIQALLRSMIEAEDAAKPLSDQALANALGAQGMRVARRTIAKYRDELRIPPSSERLRRA